MAAIVPLCGQDIHPWLAGSGGAIYYNGGNVGIGTASPSRTLTVQTSGTGNGAVNFSSNVFGGIVASSAGSNAGRLYLYPSDNVVTIIGNGQTANYTGLEMYGNSSVVNLLSTSGNSYLNGGNVGIGTTTPTHKLSVNGTIGTKEVVVTSTGWADYVFAPAYRVRPLSEINAYIQQHQRLPDMPSAEEVREKGVDLGAMQVKLLAKIEEMTLHMIQMERQNQELQKRLAELESAAERNARAPEEERVR